MSEHDADYWADYWETRFRRMKATYRERFNEGLSTAEWHAKHCAAMGLYNDLRAGVEMLADEAKARKAAFPSHPHWSAWDHYESDLRDLLASPAPEAATVERCPDCGHAPHDQIAFCPNMASDNDCNCTRTTPDPVVPADGEGPHIVHVTVEPIAEDVVWCDECEEWVESGAPERDAPADGARDAGRLNEDQFIDAAQRIVLEDADVPLRRSTLGRVWDVVAARLAAVEADRDRCARLAREEFVRADKAEAERDEWIGVAEKVSADYAEAEARVDRIASQRAGAERVEWGVDWANGSSVENCEGNKEWAEDRADARPERTLLRRTITEFAPVVSPWVAVEAGESDGE